MAVRRDVGIAYRNYDAARKTLEVLRNGVVGQNQQSFYALAEECQFPADMDAVFAEVAVFFDLMAGSKARS